MNDNEKAVLEEIEKEKDFEFDFDKLENQLEANLEDSLSELEFLKEDKNKISNPDSLGEAVMDVVWDQVVIQIGKVAGEDFVKDNRGKRLDLSRGAHILDADSFEKGILPEHNFNNYGKYEKRYEETMSDLLTDPDMPVKMTKNMRYNEKTGTYERYDKNKDEWIGKIRYNKEKGVWEGYNVRRGRWENKLAPDARKKFDNRTSDEKGSKSVHKDHVIPAVDQIRDNEAAAYMDREARQKFAKSPENIQDLPAPANQSKSNLTNEEFLDKKRSDGQTQAEYFGLDEEELRQKGKEAREAYEKEKKKAKEKVINEGHESQKDEVFRIGGKALRGMIMGLLAELLRNIISELIKWFKSKEKSFKTFKEKVKKAIKTFLTNVKKNVLVAGNTIGATVLDAIFGPVVSAVQKVWKLIKQGGESVKKAIAYVKDPANRNQSFAELTLNVGKIIMAGLTAMGALVLSEVIEKALSSFPVFAINIPMLGSLANLIGIFLGAVVAGIAGALILNLIDKRLAKRQKRKITEQQIEIGNATIRSQEQMINICEQRLEETKIKEGDTIKERHAKAGPIIEGAVKNIIGNSGKDFKDIDNAEDFAYIDANLDTLI